MSAYGLMSDIFVFLFFIVISGVSLVIGGVIALLLIKGSDVILVKIFGIVVFGVSVLFALFMFISAVMVFFEDRSIKDDNDIELISTLSYEREVRLYEPHTSKPVGNTLYLYYLEDGAEIGLSKRQHKYVQEYSYGSEFRIIFYNDATPREYDAEIGLFEEAKGTPLVEADYVEIIEN